MISGLTKEENNFLFSELILPLKKMGCKVFLFGSRANGKYKKFSDIDILYVEPLEADKKVASNKIQNLIATMEESSFAYKVDLVNYNELAQSYKHTADLEKQEL